ncbi:MAG TPA: FliG C-terminal domain-containing protein [Sedimentisphaerales bacterium]|nr:FliG C-terminal domain-containing protein [Sedimentisphaerales bacterium]
MRLTGRQKAAVLLMSLDTATSTELLRGLAPDEIEDIGIELGRLEASGERDAKEDARVVREFFLSLQKGQNQKATLRSFLNETLSAVVGKDKAEQIRSKIRRETSKKDPFAGIRSAKRDELVLALEGEHPQTVAVVLSELAPQKGQEVLSLLSEELRLKAVRKMTNQEMLGAGVRERIASMVDARLKTFEGEVVLERPERREQSLRKLAIVLSGLERELRDQLLDELKKHDEETSTTVRNLMITWEDIPSIADRSLQEALRAVEAKTLAVALYGVEEEIAQKIRSNVSERVAAALDEETSLMQEPLPKEVFEAREVVVEPLRKANEESKLRFVKR